jgi:hypothetical protein
MRSFLGALRLPHFVAIGLVLALLAGGVPSKWFGLVSSRVSQVERLRACLERHSVELASLVTSIGDPQSVLSESHAARVHDVHAAERRGRLERREGQAIVACARSVSPGADNSHRSQRPSVRQRR